jgi:transcriptional regulator with XRE-family HTH domain
LDGPKGNGLYFYRKLRELEAIQKGEKNRYRQQDLAEHLGCPRSKISLMEGNHVLPTPAEIEKLSGYLKVTPGQLFAEEVITAIFAIAGSGKGGGKD